MSSNAVVNDVFTIHYDYEPVSGKSYFYDDETPPSGFHKTSVLIPMYNESITELKRTLDDLHACIIEMNKIGGGYVHILGILDGWKATHPTIKEYLTELFPGVKKDIENIGSSTNPVETYIVQKVCENKATNVDIGANSRIKLSFIIKLDNRRKHNSHAWFLETFAVEMKSDFVFLTDCGTRFDPKCLINLYRGISSDDDCSAITGRQRVMTTDQQGSTDTFRGFMYRSMQRFDYEASLASYVGAFSLLGMLPVVPGPCGLYRFSAICEIDKRQEMLQAGALENGLAAKEAEDAAEAEYLDAIDFYIKTVSLNPDETGMLLGSLLLAEDRILSYAAVLKTKKRFHTKYDASACFYFEAETNPTTLLQQRRRWINGTLAGYLWLLSNISLLFDSKLCMHSKILLTILVVSQLMMFAVMSVGVAILTVAIRYPLLVSLGLPRYVVETIVGTYFALYVLFVFFHASPHRLGPKLNTVLFDIMTFVNVIVAAIMAYGFIINLMTYERIVNVVIIAFNMCMPFILAAMHDWKSLTLMFGSFIQYAMLLPTFTVTLTVYAFSRFWELTWGNRPSDSLVTLKKQRTEDELTAIKCKLQVHAQTIAWFLVVLNLILAAVFAYAQNLDLFIVVLQLFIFAWSSVQMLLSLLYFIGNRVCLTYNLFKRLIVVHSTSQKALDVHDKIKESSSFPDVVRAVEQELIITAK